MKLRQTNQQTAVAAAQIIGLSDTRVTVQTENGCILRIPLSQNHQQDQVFLASLHDIWRNHVWIPVNTTLHQLFRYDWLIEPERIDD
ncbi:hypothetical protein [uncultured Limosilactobacillus sp.]|uniref:hypothetical protein n=1 Tax=uncultured Limosilactobacillus sp. TaxID=2837629 RepID=UPI0025E3E301|nr:hypothetical protein [uncultured Limosilactobacillus sp.]